MTRAPGALAAAAVLLGSAVAPAPAAPAPRLLAGATSVTVSLPDDTPLGGYDLTVGPGLGESGIADRRKGHYFEDYIKPNTPANQALHALVKLIEAQRGTR